MRAKQTARILTYMQNNGKINPMDALNECGCMRLASRISDLKKEGYPITKKMVKVTNRFGEKCSIAEYSLEAE